MKTMIKLVVFAAIVCSTACLSSAQKATLVTAEKQCLAADLASVKLKLANGVTSTADAKAEAVALTEGEIVCALRGVEAAYGLTAAAGSGN